MNKNDKKQFNRSKKGLIDPNKTKTFLVTEETCLLDFLKEKIPNQSQHNICRIIANHQVAVGGAPVSLFKYKLYPDDEVILSHSRIAKHQRKDLPIIYEDKDIVAINKPSGLLSIASDREKGRTAYRLISDYITQKDRNARIFVVHRLDEDTSGVLIFAKNYETKEALQDNWSDIVKKRGYYAIVEPNDIPEKGHLENYLATDEVTFNVYVTKDKRKGKLCITDYKKIATNKKYALLDVNISTGRKNQIRVQLGHKGYYIIGDDRYGEPSNPLRRLGLHAYELDFTNPLNGKEYKLNCPIPPNFKKLMASDGDFVVKEDKRKEKGSVLGKNQSKTRGSKKQTKGHASKGVGKPHKQVKARKYGSRSKRK